MSSIRKYIKSLQLKEHSFKALPSNYFEYPYSDIINEIHKQYGRSKVVDLALINIPEAKECLKENIRSDSFGEYEHAVKYEYAKRIKNSFSIPENPEDVPVAAMDLSKTISNILEGDSSDKTIKEFVRESINEFYERCNKSEQGNQYDIRWGWNSLDDITYGLRPKLVYIAARPSMGKSLIISESAKNIAKEGKQVVIFSAEMSAVDITSRMIYSEAGIEGVYYNSGCATQVEMQKVERVVDVVSNLPITIIDKSGMTPEFIRNKVLQFKNEGKCDVVMIDYLQKLTMYHMGKDENAYLGAASNLFQNLMKEANIPIIIASQLNRSVETRGGSKMPQMSDLRGSGSIEQDADIIIFLYRPYYYGITEDDNGENIRDVIELIIEKNRGGRLGDVKLYHDNMSRVASTRFEPEISTIEPYNPTQGMPTDPLQLFNTSTDDDVPF